MDAPAYHLVRDGKCMTTCTFCNCFSFHQSRGGSEGSSNPPPLFRKGEGVPAGSAPAVCSLRHRGVCKHWRTTLRARGDLRSAGAIRNRHDVVILMPDFQHSVSVAVSRCRCRFRKNRVRTGRLCRCCWGVCAAERGRSRRQGAKFPTQKSGRSSRRVGTADTDK